MLNQNSSFLCLLLFTKIKAMKFEISRIELKQNEFGKNDLVIKQIKVTDNNGKYIKFAKLNDELLKAIKNAGVLTVKK